MCVKNVIALKMFCFLTISVFSQITSGNRPNIVVIMADDLDSKQLSCYGGANMQTPHIDALANSGMRFTNMITSEAMCAPTRASLFTGLYPAKHGTYQNHKPSYSDIKSIVHYLGDLGYRVGLTGKLGVAPKDVFPFDIVQGFEPNCIKRTDEYYLDDIEDYMKRPEPYCFFVMSINPHVPWSAGDPSEFDTEKLVLPANWVDTKRMRKEFAKFLAEIRRLDNQVGDVMNLLKKNGQLDNTIVIFLGEQGPQFPGGKWTLWHYGQRSSMIVKWPGVVKSGSVSDDLVQYEDFLPTVLDILKGKPAQGLDGISFLNVLKEQEKGRREYAYGIHNNIPAGTAYPIRSICDKNHKLIWNLSHELEYFVRMMDLTKTKSTYFSWFEKAKHDARAKQLVTRIVNRPEFEFYDLNEDPNELNNLIDNPKYATKIENYKNELKRWMKEQGDKGVSMDVKFY